MASFEHFQPSTNIEDRQGDPPMDPLDVIVKQMRAKSDGTGWSNVPEPRPPYAGLGAQAGLADLDRIEAQSAQAFKAQPWDHWHGDLLAQAEQYFKRGLISPQEYQRLVDRIRLGMMAAGEPDLPADYRSPTNRR